MYSRVPNTTVGNPYSFFGAWPSYMALFGTSRLLNFKKSSILHFYSELLAYWFFTFLESLYNFILLFCQIIDDLSFNWFLRIKFPPTFLFSATFLLIFKKISHLHFYLVLLFYLFPEKVRSYTPIQAYCYIRNSRVFGINVVAKKWL